MEDNASVHLQTSPKSASITTGSPEDTDATDSDQNLQGGGDPVVWAAFTQNFQQVQSVLDRNRALIQQVNENHQSKVHEKMVKNVALIQEINGNISKVASMYSNMSADFSSLFRQRNDGGDAKSDSEEKR